MSVERDVLKAYNALKAKSEAEPFPILTIERGVPTDIPYTVGGTGSSTDPPLTVSLIPTITSDGVISEGYGMYSHGGAVSQSGWVGVPSVNGTITVTPPENAPPGVFDIQCFMPVGGTYLFTEGYCRLS